MRRRNQAASQISSTFAMVSPSQTELATARDYIAKQKQKSDGEYGKAIMSRRVSAASGIAWGQLVPLIGPWKWLDTPFDFWQASGSSYPPADLAAKKMYMDVNVWLPEFGTLSPPRQDEIVTPSTEIYGFDQVASVYEIPGSWIQNPGLVTATLPSFEAHGLYDIGAWSNPGMPTL